MDTSSEYAFPIFISSTDYNLKDFRAELARFLSELGYRPILSSAEGFPDNSPKLEPWESCIPVLQQAFVMILVIDGKYGYPLKWPNCGELFAEKEVSPTHGEYLYAQHHGKRMLVFIRSEVMTFYQSYRRAMKACDERKEDAEKILKSTLPEYIEFKTLQFIHEIKTTKPIPWIREFNDITSVKKEVQKKMLNELAEIFLVKNMHLETIVQSFNKVLASMSLGEQKNVLEKINGAKDLIVSAEKMEIYQRELSELKVALDETKVSNVKEKAKYEKKIAQLKNDILELEKDTLESTTNQFYIRDGGIRVGNPRYLDSSSFIASGFQVGNNSGFVVSGDIPAMFSLQKCENCHKPPTLTLTSSKSLLNGHYLRTCPGCDRYLCNDCWPFTPATVASFGYNDTCPRCKSDR